MLRYLTFAHCIPVRASNRSSFGLHPGPNGHTQIPPFGGLATPHPCGDNSSVGARSLSMLALTATAGLEPDSPSPPVLRTAVAGRANIEKERAPHGEVSPPGGGGATPPNR